MFLLYGSASVAGLLAVELSKYSLDYDQEGSVALHWHINVPQLQYKQDTYQFAQEEWQNINYVFPYLISEPEEIFEVDESVLLAERLP